jgi:hypothetical protein
MPYFNPLFKYKKHLEDKYKSLLEKSSNYYYIDEIKSDSAAYKAMKILIKINKINYLNR